MTTLEIIIFIAGTILILLFSWRISLREKRYHGIPRFFAFEGLLYLGIVQGRIWFADPVSTIQIFSWILLIVSITYITGAFSLYFRHTKPDLNFENSAKLVTTGIYKYIRHPMYASLLFLGWGMFLKDINLHTIIAVSVVSGSLLFTCFVEEKEMIARFGDEYKDYMTKTKMWIPKIL